MQLARQFVNSVALQQHEATCFIQRISGSFVLMNVSVEVRASQQKNDRNLWRTFGTAVDRCRTFASMKRDKNIATLAGEFLTDSDVVPARFQQARPPVGGYPVSFAGTSRSRSDDQDSSHVRCLPSFARHQPQAGQFQRGISR